MAEGNNCLKKKINKTKVIMADLLDLDLDFYFEAIFFRLCNTSVNVTFHFCKHFSFGDILVFSTISLLVTFQFY